MTGGWWGLGGRFFWRPCGWRRCIDDDGGDGDVRWLVRWRVWWGGVWGFVGDYRAPAGGGRVGGLYLPLPPDHPDGTTLGGKGGWSGGGAGEGGRGCLGGGGGRRAGGGAAAPLAPGRNPPSPFCPRHAVASGWVGSVSVDGGCPVPRPPAPLCGRLRLLSPFDYDGTQASVVFLVAGGGAMAGLPATRGGCATAARRFTPGVQRC